LLGVTGNHKRRAKSGQAVPAQEIPMFDRNKPHTVEQGTLSVAVTLSDGDTFKGKLTVTLGRSIADILNGTAAFLEFEPFGEDKILIAKACIVKVQPLELPSTVNLQHRAREFDGFDPHTVLGIERTANWDQVRQAYITLAKDYHPDRYSNVELPAEIKTYLASMARRVNIAYAALEPVYVLKKETAGLRQTPIYTSPSMRG
jgi:hypothetical protein